LIAFLKILLRFFQNFFKLFQKLFKTLKRAVFAAQLFRGKPAGNTPVFSRFPKVSEMFFVSCAREKIKILHAVRQQE